MLYTTILVLSHSSQVLGERLIIGLLTGLAMTIIISVVSRKTVKKSHEEVINNQSFQIASDSNKKMKKQFDVVYCNLYNELKDKCNPANFLEPYDAEKVEAANSIYSLLEDNKDDISRLTVLRNEAIDKLGIAFSTKEIYSVLCNVFDPKKYINENYDPEKLQAANKIYSLIQQGKDNILELEKIARKYGIISMPTEGHSDNYKIGKNDIIFICGFVFFMIVIVLVILATS